MNQRRLGRGLEALLGRSLEEPAQQNWNDAAAPAEQPALVAEPSLTGEPTSTISSSYDDAIMGVDDQGQKWLDLGVIEPNPYQPRRKFDEVEIADLADSIREHGVLQPLVVRRVGERFELVAGERRLRAAQAAGWRRVPVQLRDFTDRQTAEVAIVENVQRSDLNAIEKGVGFERYLEQFGGTQEELARRVNIDRSTVANLIRLLELPESVKQMVIDGELTQGHARALLSLGDESRQVSLARRATSEGMSVRKVEQEVQDLLAGPTEESFRVVGADGVSRKATPTRGEQIAYLEQELQRTLGTKVQLTQSAKGKGKITLHFTSADEFERLRAILMATEAPSATGTY
ncbi:MAG: ParB/RepB/Spo0J family partition protein [Lacipirellulaceae bacterium]